MRDIQAGFGFIEQKPAGAAFTLPYLRQYARQLHALLLPGNDKAGGDGVRTTALRR